MSKFQIIFIGFFMAILCSSSAFSAFAQNLGPDSKAPLTDPQDCQGKTFGCFEVGLPGITQGDSIDDFVKDSKPILKFINLAVNAVIAVLVIIGLITIVIGGYTYMTAGGDGKKVGAAKEMITAALAGIVLSLISVIILNTINKYLGSDAQEPQLGKSSTTEGSNSSPLSRDRLEKLRDDHVREIGRLQGLLQDPNLSASDRELYTTVMRNTQISLDDFNRQLSDLNR